MKEAKRLRRTRRYNKKLGFFEVLAFRYRQFLGLPEPDWTRYKDVHINHKPDKDPGRSNKERLLAHRVDMNHYGRKRHGRFTITDNA